MVKNDYPWKRKGSTHSLSEVFSSVNIPAHGFWKKLFAFSGPGLMVAVGYMDPGNWATDVAGGSQFGYALLTVVLMSSLFAMVLQHLSLKLGIAAERDLAQACRDHFSPPVNFVLWILCEIAIAATDLAEVIGTAIALNLLFGLPLIWGVGLTVIDVFIILLLQRRGFRWLESVVGGLVFVVAACFAYQLVLSRPDVFPILRGLLPSPAVVTDPAMLYIAIGILGATVMPHNLYLHSSIVQTRNYVRSLEGKREAIKFATIDSTLSLVLAFAINAAILIVAAATFYRNGHYGVVEIGDAYKMLEPLLGTGFASMAFGVALLAAGQNSTVTGTLAGQIVMEGFVDIRLKPWLRRLITRMIAVVPAFFVTWFFGDGAASQLLVFSQVILSLQLSFAVVPLVAFTGDRAKMGIFANGRVLTVVSWFIAAVIILLNLYLLRQTFIG